MMLLNRWVRRRAVALNICVALIASAAGATTAHAGTLDLNASIQGAGSIAASAGGSFSCDKTGNQDERVTVACDPSSFAVLLSASVTLVPTASSTPSGHWQFDSWTGCDSVVNDACIVSSGPFTTDAKYPKARFIDTRVPTVTADEARVGDRSATFVFHADEPADFFCKLDAGPLEPCGTNVTSPPEKTYTSLSEGGHTFSVQAYDRSGQAGAALERTVTIVDTALTETPASPRNSRTATFRYSTVGGNAFECSVDSGSFSPCGTGSTGSETVTVAGDGAHTFRVRAVNGGASDPVPASHTWTVDTAAPDTTLSALSGPAEAALLTSTSATFAFASTEAGTYECRLGSQPFGACTSPKELTGLAPGQHTFEVRAIDAAGNVDPTPATRSWTVVHPDADGDGYNAAQDCDDADAAINPGKTEILDNDVDENCDGTAGRTAVPTTEPEGPQQTEQEPQQQTEQQPQQQTQQQSTTTRSTQHQADPGQPQPLVQPAQQTPTPALGRITSVAVRSKSKSGKSGTTFSVLQATGVPAGSTVTATCKPKKRSQRKLCPRAFRTSNASGTVTIKGFNKRRLAVGLTITISVSKPTTIGVVKILTIRKGKAPSGLSRCLPVGSSKPAVGCPG